MDRDCDLNLPRWEEALFSRTYHTTISRWLPKLKDLVHAKEASLAYWQPTP
jgi:hypothetical protein